MPTVIFINHLGQSQTVLTSEGGGLAKLCEEVDSPVPFHCRRAKCGTCRIEVLEGINELLPPKESELNLLKIFGLSPDQYRLACQAQMRPGLAPLRVRPLEKRAPRRYSLWIPVTINSVSKQIQVCMPDVNSENIFISGTNELKIGDVVLLNFYQPSGEKSHNVVGRIIQLDPSTDMCNGIRSCRLAIEFFEPDATLNNLFKTAFIETSSSDKCSMNN